ncbi:MAG: diacylglycerol kinase family protein [Ruminococcus sp.]|nr:diacylglycerol kinase family protein [Ruminococcus sp.]
MKKQLKSFGFAFKGIYSALKEEGHMRFHLVAAVYVIVFSFFFDLSVTEFAVVALIIGAVISAELINTALERLCDRVTTEFDTNIKYIKDVCAAAVLVLAAAAIAVAFLIFFDIKKITAIALNIINNPLLLILFILSLIISVVFIWLGPIGIKQLITKDKKSA